MGRKLDFFCVTEKAVKRTWTRQRKIFCRRANLVTLRRCIGLEICLKSHIRNGGVSGAGRQFEETAGLFWSSLRNKFGCSTQALEVLL